MASLKGVASAPYCLMSMYVNYPLLLLFEFLSSLTNSDAQKNPKVLEQHLLHSYHQTKNFCDQHQLVINPSKSQLIVFQAQGNRLPSDFALEVDGCKITPAHSVKLLGVTLDRYLTFGEHTDNVVKKCHGLIGVLAKAAPYLTRQLITKNVPE